MVINQHLLSPATVTLRKSEEARKTGYTASQMFAGGQAVELIQGANWKGPQDWHVRPKIRTGLETRVQQTSPRRFQWASPYKPPRPVRPQVALVLSGGAARASSHIGVLEVLWDVLQPSYAESAKIRTSFPKIFVATSAAVPNVARQHVRRAPA